MNTAAILAAAACHGQEPSRETTAQTIERLVAQLARANGRTVEAERVAQGLDR